VPEPQDLATRATGPRELYGLLDEVIATRTTAEWLEILGALEAPVVKANRLEELPHDPHLKAVDLFQELRHPHAGPYKSMRPPVRFSATPSNVRRHPPLLGEHTAEILAETSSEEPA